MYSPRNSYTSTYSSSYITPKSYSSVSASLPPIQSRYTSTTGYSPKYLSRPTVLGSTTSPTSRYSSTNLYSSSSNTLPHTRTWRSTISSPSLTRKNSVTDIIPRRPSYSSGLNFRSGSLSSSASSSSTSEDTGKRYTTSSNIGDEWLPRTTRGSSISSSIETSSFSPSSYRQGLLSTGDSKLAGRVGLHNLGNTCFMNAVLQCLCHTQPLVEYCKRGSFSTDINHRSPTGGELIKAFSSLIAVLWKDSARNAVSPDNLKRELQKYAPRFSGYSQQDAQELLRFLLQGLHDDINRVTGRTAYRSSIAEFDPESHKAADSWKRYQSTDDSKIVDIFGGQLKSTLKCTECNNSSVTFDPFWDLSLPIPESLNHISLQQCFELFTSPESLEGSEKPLCEKCKRKTRSTKQLEIYKFPKILVIHLKRFSSGANYRNKLNVTVDYSLKNLDLATFSAASSPDLNTVYDLYGIVDHFGSSSSGHYTSKCRNPYTKEWNEFNDNVVGDVSATRLVTDKAYLLFYELAHAGRRSSKL